MVFDIRNASPTGINGEFHPLLKKSFWRLNKSFIFTSYFFVKYLTI
jgi:hypothetical protein